MKQKIIVEHCQLQKDARFIAKFTISWPKSSIQFSQFEHLIVKSMAKSTKFSVFVFYDVNSFISFLLA